LWSSANESALALVGLLQSHPAVDKVWHPSVTCRAEYDAVRKPQGGYGGLLSFTLKAAKKTAKFYETLQVSKGPSFGTPFTLICPYTLLAHYRELPWAEGCGVPSHLLRVSVGTEGSQHICDTFQAALDAI
jgi:cystathionine gamma-synthase